MTDFEHEDKWYKLNQHLPLHEKLAFAHQTVQENFKFIARIAVTLYDPETRVLKSYLHSGSEDDPMAHYQALLDDAPSLVEVLKKGRPRVINQLVTQEKDCHEHTQRIGRRGYAASYTLPMFNNGSFVGFLFFNSYEKDVFIEGVLSKLDIYGHLIALLVINELTTIETLSAAVKTSGHITHVRSPETGSHLDRMSRYSRIIAHALAESHHLNDEYIEHIFMFAPLHDIGKIAIPDHILLKSGKLDQNEITIMQSHAHTGRQMIDEIISNFGLEGVDDIDVLRNIAEYHHEAINGTGYPEGKSGDNIPLEARIVAVADVFDALTSRRCYKEAWSNEDAFAMLIKCAGEKLDKDCVEALIENKDKALAIQQQFTENRYG